MGLRNIHPERFARALTKYGYPCFGFDYRGFSPSAGTPRRVLLEEQIRDIRHAAIFASAQDELSGVPVLLLGWGMGGGLVLQAAYGVPRLAGLICLNGFYNGRRVQRAVRDSADWARFEQWLLEDRRARVSSSEPRLADPFDIYPLDAVSRKYVDEVLRKNSGFGGEVHTVLADSLLSFAPERHLDGLEGVPLFVGHGDQNLLHPVEEARSLYRSYPGPATLYLIEGGGHTEWMADDNPLFVALMQRIADWLEQLG
jgi:hypothetical protein